MDKEFIALYLDTKINDYNALASLVGGFKLGVTKMPDLDHIKLSFIENHLSWTSSISINNESTINIYTIYYNRIKKVIYVKNHNEESLSEKEDNIPTYREILQKVQIKSA